VLGSTVNGILHGAEIDVLTIRVDDQGKRLANFPYQNIVLALDLAADHQKVVASAIDLCQTFKATLHVIHVTTDIAALGYYPAIEFSFSDEAAKAVHALVARESIPVDFKNIHVEVGFPKQEILDLAARVKAELIVIGSHGRHAFASAVIGSTANAIMHGAKSDVMVVRV
jgi:universal stress protein A